MNNDKKAAIVVLLLIALTVAAYPFTSTGDNWQIYGIQSYSFFQEGKFKPLITAIFTHADEWHIFGNMIFLFVFGITLAAFIGWKKFLIVYFIGGIAGNLAWVIYPVIDKGAASVTAVGASGAVFAVMAALAMAKPKNAADIAEKSEILKFFPNVPWLGLIYTLIIGERILGFVGIIFYFLFVTVPDLILGEPVAHAIHFGGMLAGLVLGYLFKCKNDETDEDTKHNVHEKKYEDVMPVHDYDGFNTNK